jgi:hypothetical protein
LPGTAGLPPFICFSTSYPELDSAVRRPMSRIGNRGRNISRAAQATLLVVLFKSAQIETSNGDGTCDRYELFCGR